MKRYKCFEGDPSTIVCILENINGGPTHELIVLKDGRFFHTIEVQGFDINFLKYIRSENTTFKRLSSDLIWNMDYSVEDISEEAKIMTIDPEDCELYLSLPTLDLEYLTSYRHTIVLPIISFIRYRKELFPKTYPEIMKKIFSIKEIKTIIDDYNSLSDEEKLKIEIGEV